MSKAEAQPHLPQENKTTSNSSWWKEGVPSEDHQQGKKINKH